MKIKDYNECNRIHKIDEIKWIIDNKEIYLGCNNLRWVWTRMVLVGKKYNRSYNLMLINSY